MTAATRNPVSESKGGFLYSSVVVGVTATFMGLMLMIANIVNKIQPVPYLDEIYHIPQAVQYCHGNFSHVSQILFHQSASFKVSVFFYSSGMTESQLYLGCI